MCFIQDSARRMAAPDARRNPIPLKRYEQEHLITTTGQSRSGSFACRNCGAQVPLVGAGSRHRNHCPNCLHTIHLDDMPGDRQSDCGGVMEPVAVWVRKGGEWAIVHRCRDCGALSSTRIAADDNPMLLISIAARPLANPPFPLDRLDH